LTPTNRCSIMVLVSSGARSSPYRGVLLGESLRLDAVLDASDLRVLRIWCTDAGDPDAGQPSRWTFIEFEVAAERTEELEEKLTGLLDASGGWYCSFGSDHEMVVVFAGRSFRYRRGEEQARQEIETYARSVGVPDAQLDWETWTFGGDGS